MTDNSGLFRLLLLLIIIYILASIPIIPIQKCAITILGHSAGCHTEYVTILQQIANK
jgi:hypothetical protein